jgi:hypothetical protein
MDNNPTTDEPTGFELGSIKRACFLLGAEDASGKIRPIHPSTYYRGVASGLYPAPVKIGGRSVVNLRELKQRIKACVTARDQEAA